MSDLTLGKKIALGFGVLILISGALGGMGSWQMKSAQKNSEMLAFEYVPEMELAAEIRGAANRLMFEMRGYGATGDEKLYDKAMQEVEALKTGIKNGEQLIESSVHLKKLEGQIAQITESDNKYTKLIEETHTTYGHLGEARKGLDENAALWMSQANNFLSGQNETLDRELEEEGKTVESYRERIAKITIVNDIIDIGNDTRVKAFKAQALRDVAIMQDAQKNFPKIDNKLSEIRKITRQKSDLDRLDDIKTAALGYEESMNFFSEQWGKLQELGVQRNIVAGEMITACKTLQEAAESSTIRISTESASSLGSASMTTLFGLAIAIIVGVLLAVFMIRSITGPINKVISGMQAGSDQVSSASGQVAEASTQLAEGASEQASSLEETAASLEMMLAGAKQSASNSSQASDRARTVKISAEKGKTAMAELNGAMEKIKTSSDETAKIIKTIDEIAFQTNLLALNAAVEAARAGDAGKGFAVVAEEVRNLAQRSAEAAKGTADLIAGSTENSNLGIKATAEVSTILEEIVEGAVEVSDVIEELSSTAEGQSRSVTEVNTAVAQMDSVTQANAAGAEESASAAEEMSAQASELQSLVGELMAIVGGVEKTNSPMAQSVGTHFAKRPVSSPKATTFGSGIPAGNNSAPDQVIPLDEECFLEL